MSDLKIAAIARRSQPVAQDRLNILDRREASFGVNGDQPRPGFRIERMIDLNLLLMILLIGVPVLLSCILSAGN